VFGHTTLLPSSVLSLQKYDVDEGVIIMTENTANKNAKPAFA